MTSRVAAREAVRSQYFFVATEDEAFSVFGRSEVKDINRIRQCTDIPFLIAFAIVMIAMVVLDHAAVTHGNVLRLFEPMDFEGRLCGYDEAVKDKKLGYHPNPYNDMIVCVSVCPKTGADGDFVLPDGPMGKFHSRPAYPTAHSYGQFCLPLDLHLAKQIVSVKSVQSEFYKALAVVSSARDVVFTILLVPFITSFILIIMLLLVPQAASAMAFSTTAITLALVAMITDLDQDVLLSIPLYKEAHPVGVAAQPFFRATFYGCSLFFLAFLGWSIGAMHTSQSVFRECMSAIIEQDVLVTIFVGVGISMLRIWFILHVCTHFALLMSILNPVQVRIELFGEWSTVDRKAWSPYYMKGCAFYAFGTFWALEFLSFCNKYITAQVICHNYFELKARTETNIEIRVGKSNPAIYAFYSLFRYHLGSVAYSALLAFPCRLLRFIIGFFVPDRPNLYKSKNPQYKIAYYLFWPLIQMDLRFLRFFKDSVWVMLPLKGQKYMDAAKRSEGLLNRSRGKIPNLTKFIGKVDVVLNISVGLQTLFWTFFMYREPRHGRYHEVQHLTSGESTLGLLSTPEHSPLLALPVMFFFGIWVGNGMLHLCGMAAEALTVCYCIDVEMVGGTETDALYVPGTLKDVYKDLGGGESERERAELIADGEQAGG